MWHLWVLFCVIFLGLGSAQAQYCGEEFSSLDNRNKINAMVGLACSIYAHMVEEKTPRNRRHGSNSFHSWELREGANEYTINGYCAKKFNFETKRVQFDNGELKLNINRSSLSRPNPVVKGSVGGKALIYTFKDTSFYKPECRSVVKNQSLQMIQVGKSVFDFLNPPYVTNATVIQGPSNFQIWPEAPVFKGDASIDYDNMNLLFTWRPTSVPVQAVVAAGGPLKRQFLVQIEDHVVRALGNEDGIGREVRRDQIANHIFETELLPYSSYSTSGCSVVHRESELAIPSRLDWQDCLNLQDYLEESRK